MSSPPGGIQALAARALMNELASRGTTIRAWPTNVADATQVERLVERIASELPPLRGVFHAAAVLDDRTLVNTRPSQAAAVLEPKVAGAWNLHQLTSQCELDCFVLFSSAASMLGSPGQGDYAAGNAFLDALAHYRREHGIPPALSVNWGPVGGRRPSRRPGESRPSAGDRGMASVDPDRGLALLGRLLEGDAVQVAVLPLDLRECGQFYPTAAAAPVYSALTDAAHASARETGPLRRLVKATGGRPPPRGG